MIYDRILLYGEYMIDHTIEDIVRSYIPFANRSNQGWSVVFCEVCGDGSRTQGPRGGWLFQNDKAFYNCFNCSVHGSFDPDREYAYSREMRNILKAFSIPLAETDPLTQKKFLEGRSAAKPVKRAIAIPTIDMPDYFYPLIAAEPTNSILHKAVRFLDTKGIDFLSYPFYLSSGKSTAGVAENAIAKSLTNRLIIPAFRGEKMIYYIARSFQEDAKKRYLNPPVPKNSVIYGMDKLFIDLEKPLFVTDGFFDAHHLDGVATLGNVLSTAQIDILNKSPRRKVIIPDKKLKFHNKDDGKMMAKQALDLGWHISLPEYGNCKDVTASIVKYGKMFVMNSINKNIVDGFAGNVALSMW